MGLAERSGRIILKNVSFTQFVPVEWSNVLFLFDFKFRFDIHHVWFSVVLATETVHMCEEGGGEKRGGGM